MADSPVHGPVELVLPADTRLVRVVRLMASGLASTMGFDVDELDDLRIGVDELLAALLEGGDGTPLALRFDLNDSELAVSGETPSGTGEAFEQGRLELSTLILAAVVDDHSFSVEDGRVRVEMRKRHGGG